MSVFRVYSGAVDPLQEHRGTAIVGERFEQVYKHTLQSSPNAKPKDFFENLIADAIGQGCRVTYNPTANPDGAEFPVGIRTEKGNRKFFYTIPGPPPQEEDLKLVAEQDNPNDKKVSMAVPSRPVRFDDAYLSRAVGVFMDPNIGTDAKQKFLLGLLLLKRCR
jgi:hypothetical protein